MITFLYISIYLSPPSRDDASAVSEWRLGGLAHTVRSPLRAQTMGWSLQRMMWSACMGGMIGAGAAVAGSLIQVGRMPPRAQIGGSAAMMATIIGVGSCVR